MVNRKNIAIGDIVWFCIWRLSASGKRVVKEAKPKQVKISGFDDFSGFFIIEELEPSKARGIGIRIHNSHLYYTEDDAWDSYNSSIYDAIDRETKLHEKTLKHLKSKLHDRSRKN